MALETVYRASYQILHLDVSGSEPLTGGIFSRSQAPESITLHNLDTDGSIDMAMASVDAMHWEGELALTPLLDGHYRLEGSVVDQAGNVALLDQGAVDLQFSIMPGVQVAYVKAVIQVLGRDASPLVLKGGDAALALPSTDGSLSLESSDTSMALPSTKLEGRL